MSQLQFADKRKLKRFSVRLKVYENTTGKLLGYAEDLHTEGMKLMSKSQLPDRTELKICFGTLNSEDDDKKIEVSAFKVWSSFTDTEPRHYYSGLHFISPSDETLDCIEDLIDETA